MTLLPEMPVTNSPRISIGVVSSNCDIYCDQCRQSSKNTYILIYITLICEHNIIDVMVTNYGIVHSKKAIFLSHTCLFTIVFSFSSHSPYSHVSTSIFYLLFKKIFFTINSILSSIVHLSEHNNRQLYQSLIN